MAKPEFNDSTLSRLLQTRDYHLAQAKRIDDALSVFRDVDKLATKAARVTGHARARATGQPFQAGPNAREFVTEHANLKSNHPSDEIRRLIALAQSNGQTQIGAQGLTSAFYAVRKAQGINGVRSGASIIESKDKRLRRLRKSGDTATDRVRRLFSSNGNHPLTRDQIINQAKLAEIVQSHVPQAAIRVLESMTKRKELKKTRDGWVAFKLQPPTVAPPA